MLCRKCNTEMPAMFEYLIAQNVCGKCGSKLMPDKAMKVYIDLKTRLNEVEFVMDKAIVCERVAMFLISNYEIIPLAGGAVPNASPNAISNSSVNEKLAAMDNALAVLNADEGLSNDEIRQQEEQRAADLLVAREYGLDPDEEMVTGALDHNKVDRLRKLASSTKAGTGVRRIE